mmetsp:Transcript_20044/g.50224  ORF Transcript_20044/g.50224 Transcript_20044/m.50224 type:complete len:276 (-) Transcript_20044:157-984(-)
MMHTIEAPETQAAAVKLCVHLRYTGYFKIEIVVDAKTGLLYLIDPNMRASIALSIDGAMLGIGDSPLVRLRQAVSGELPLSHFAANWYTPLAHSIVAVSFYHSPTDFLQLPTDLMYCPSVYTAFPTQLAQYVSKGAGTLVTDERDPGLQCRYTNTKRRPGLSIQLTCGRSDASVCAHPPACKPLLAVSTPVPTIADVLIRLCDPEYNWRRFAHCAARARAEQKAATDARSAAFTLGPYDDGYWAKFGLSLCRDMRWQPVNSSSQSDTLSSRRPGP